MEAGGRRSKLPDLVDLEFVGLSLHLLEEDGQVGGDLVWADQVLSIFASVKFLTKVLAHVVDFGNCLRVLHVWLLCVFKPYRSQNFQLFIHSPIVKSLFFLG